MVLKKTFESPLDCKEIQLVHPKEISPECSLEGLMLRLKLQYFGHLMLRADLPGSSHGGSREFKAGTALKREKTYLFINIRLD